MARVQPEMGLKLRLTRRADDYIENLAPGLRGAVLSALIRLAAEPREAGKPLRGRMRGTWAAKVGSYRILYTIEGAEPAVTVVVRAVLHRSVAYVHQ